MDKSQRKSLTVEITVSESIEKVWEYWTDPQHIMQWNNASPDWHTPASDNDLRPEGRFLSRMEAKNGSFGFDFSGTYVEVIPHEIISYILDDERKVEIRFSTLAGSTQIVETFEVEDTNTLDRQQFGWQSILDNFKKYVETK